MNKKIYLYIVHQSRILIIGIKTFWRVEIIHAIFKLNNPICQMLRRE